MSETLLVEVEADVPAVWLAIGGALRDRMISNIAQLAQTLAFETKTIREGLEYWASRGMVDVMRPFNRQQPFDDELDFYVWKKSSDRDFLWEQNI